MSVIDFPIRISSNGDGPANDNPQPIGLSCVACEINVYRIWLRDGEFVIECISCGTRVTDGILTYAFGQQDSSA